MSRSGLFKGGVRELFVTSRRLAKAARARLGQPRIHGIGHAGVTVSDFEAAVAWWSELFGFLLVTEQTISGPEAEELTGLYGASGLTVRLGFLRGPDGSVLEIFTFDPPIEAQRTDWRRPGYTHIALSVSDVPGLYRKLKARGIKFVTDVRYTAGAHWAFFRDPDDNLIEIIDLHANRLPLKYLGGLVGRSYQRGKWASYYL